MTETLDWETAWLPRYPYATDDLSQGIWRQKRDEAMGRRYIEANPQALTNLLVVDIDDGIALQKAIWCTSYPPNWVVENPANGHAHALWVLANPIPRTEMAHYKPIAYAHAITEGLRISLNGDKGYSGLLTKNPLHSDWETYPLTTAPYTLDELRMALEIDGCMPGKRWRKTKRRYATGLGRNCTIFDSARLWAYREVRNHFGNPESLAQAVTAHVHGLNDEFKTPLPEREADQIAASIVRWIVTESRLWNDGPAVYEATFTAIQSARGRRGARKTNRIRAKNTRSKIMEVLNG